MDSLNLQNQVVPSLISGLEEMGSLDSIVKVVSPLEVPPYNVVANYYPAVSKEKDFTTVVPVTQSWSDIFGWQHNIDTNTTAFIASLTGNPEQASLVYSIASHDDTPFTQTQSSYKSVPSNVGLQSNISSSFLQQNVYPKLQKFVQLPNFQQLMHSIFGNSLNIEKLDEIADQWMLGDFRSLPIIEVYQDSVFRATTLGAFGGATDKIYLSEKLLNSGNIETITDTIIEEIGHWVDKQLNEQDTPGDEGEKFSAFVTGKHLNAEKIAAIDVEDDSTTIFVDNQLVRVEQASIDLAGNTTATAKNIGTIGTTTQTFTDLVGDIDLADYYQFNLTNTSTISLNLNGLSLITKMATIRAA
ncbi:hypothetical protein [Trichormus sp. NMC-1]|uniref:hypothetical protein n=1 Tax=Trichormus sp. NMC-1 TaxID=1853259 RepID=UPI0008DC1A7F|nr:hypothetical protein [Trichormus sp. NMC-1]